MNVRGLQHHLAQIFFVWTWTSLKTWCLFTRPATPSWRDGLPSSCSSKPISRSCTPCSPDGPVSINIMTVDRRNYDIHYVHFSAQINKNRKCATRRGPRPLLENPHLVYGAHKVRRILTFLRIYLPYAALAALHNWNFWGPLLTFENEIKKHKNKNI